MSDAPPPAAPDPTPLAIPPQVAALLRRHNLLLPLMRGLIEDSLVGAAPLASDEHHQLMAQWAGNAGLEQALQQAQTNMGLFRDDVIWQVERPLRLARHAKEGFSAKAEARFLQRKRDLDLVTYSLVRLKDGNLARELYLRLAAGEAGFAELAEQYSEGPERQSRGVVGPKPVSAAHPLLAERLRTARDGEVMDPFMVADWWLIVRRDAYQPALLDEAMAERMAQELLQEWIAEEAQRHLHQLNTPDLASQAAGSTTP